MKRLKTTDNCYSTSSLLTICYNYRHGIIKYRFFRLWFKNKSKSTIQIWAYHLKLGVSFGFFRIQSLMQNSLIYETSLCCIEIENTDWQSNCFGKISSSINYEKYLEQKHAHWNENKWRSYLTWGQKKYIYKITINIIVRQHKTDVKATRKYKFCND